MVELLPQLIAQDGLYRLFISPWHDAAAGSFQCFFEGHPKLAAITPPAGRGRRLFLLGLIDDDRGLSSVFADLRDAGRKADLATGRTAAHLADREARVADGAGSVALAEKG